MIIRRHVNDKHDFFLYILQNNLPSWGVHREEGEGGGAGERRGGEY